MAFIKFTEHGRSYAAKASISKNGMLSFSDGARKRFEMDKSRFCILYYDPETKRIGIEFTTDKNAEGARKIRFRSTGADVAAKSYVDFFDIGIKETMLFPIEKDNDTGYAIIELSKGKPRLKKQEN